MIRMSEAERNVDIRNERYDYFLIDEYGVCWNDVPITTRAHAKAYRRLWEPQIGRELHIKSTWIGVYDEPEIDLKSILEIFERAERELFPEPVALQHSIVVEDYGF